MRGPEERTRADEYHGRRGRQADDQGGARGVHRRGRAARRDGRRRPARPVALHQPRAQHARLLRARARRGPRHATTRCSSASSSSASSARSSASSSWCASPACASRSRPASPRSSADGYTPQQLLPIAQERAWGIMKAARQCFSELRPELDAAGIHIVDYADLDAGQQAALRRATSRTQVFPVLTPLAFDPGRPFPHISNMSHNLAVLVARRRAATSASRASRCRTSLPRLVPVPAPAGAAARRGRRRARSGSPGSSRSSPPTSRRCSRAWRSLESHPFRVTRDAELAIQELEADDLLETIEQFVRRRRFGSVIRVTIDEAMPERVRGILTENLELGDADVYAVQLAARAEQPLGRRVASTGPSSSTRRWCSRCRRRSAALEGSEHLRRHPPARRPAPPSLRLVRPRGGVPARRRQRPGRARHQADAVPRRPQRAGRRAAHGGGRQRQAGRRAGRAQGALRRGEQHRLGEGAGARGRRTSSTA